MTMFISDCSPQHFRSFRIRRCRCNSEVPYCFRTRELEDEIQQECQRTKLPRHKLTAYVLVGKLICHQYCEPTEFTTDDYAAISTDLNELKLQCAIRGISISDG